MPGCQALGATKFARHGSSRGVSAKILAQHAKKPRFSPVLGLQGELFRAHTHARPSRAKNFAHRTHKHGDIETNDTTARPQDGAVETDDASAPEKCTKDAHFSLAKATAVSIPHRYKRAKAIAVSDHRATWPTGPGCGVRGRWWGLAGLRADAPSQRLAARTARGRAAAYGHTKQPGPEDTAHSEGPEAPQRLGPLARTCVSCSQVELNVAAGDGLDQLARVVLDRVVEQLVRRVGLDELALLHDDHVVGDLADNGQVVRDE